MKTLTVTFQAAAIVWIAVAGEVDPARPGEAQDGGLVGELLAFIETSKIPFAKPPGYPGHADGGRFSFAFHPSDATTILAWLTKHGATQIPQTITLSTGAHDA